MTVSQLQHGESSVPNVPDPKDGTPGPPDGRSPRKAPRASSLKYRAKVILKEPTTAIGILGVLLFAYLIIAPIVSLLADAVFVQEGDAAKAGAPVGSLTTYYLWRTFRSPVAYNLLWGPLLNTLTVAVSVIALSVLIGGMAAWLLSRTNIFARKWFATALIVPYMLPAWTFALAWTTIFKNRTVGGQQGWLEAFGLQPPNWLAYGRLPVIIVLSLHLSPFVIMLFGSALRNLDSQLEDSAMMLGANRFTVMRKIVIPLMRPSLISAMTLIFAKAIGEFGVAYVLGLPVHFEVLSTTLYRSISSRQGGVAAVVAGAIVLIGAIALWTDTHFLKEARRFVTVGSKGSMDRTTDLGRWRVPATGAAGLFFIVSVAAPLLILISSTVMKLPGKFTFDNFTLDYWIGTDLPTVAFPQGVLRSAETWHAAWNSIWIVGTAALAAGILGVLVGYVVVRSPVRFIGSFIRQVTFLPYLVPGIAFAAAYLSLFAVQRGPIPALYGTAMILILAMMAEQMPYASRAGISAMTQLGKDPEEAAQVAGAGWFTRMFKVVLPIQRGALATGILMPFISGIKGLSLVVLLAVPGTNVLPTFSLQLVDYGYTQASNAVVLIICAVAFFGTYFTQKLLKTDLAKGLGG